MRACVRVWCVPSVLWRCWLGGRKGIRPVKNWVVWCWHGFPSGARCRLAYCMAQLMPLPLAVSCFSKIQIGLIFLVLAYLGSPGKGPLNGCVCVCVRACVRVVYMMCAFSALTLLAGWQEGYPACKNWVVRCWCGYLSGTRCRLAYGPADATATHCLFASVKSSLVLPVWYWLTRVVLEKGPLNGCVCGGEGVQTLNGFN